MNEGKIKKKESKKNEENKNNKKMKKVINLQKNIQFLKSGKGFCITMYYSFILFFSEL